jgi:hypothetical protein
MRTLYIGVVVALVVAFMRSANAATDPAGFSVLRTRHYHIHTDLDRELAEDLARRMDGMYDEYKRRLANFEAEQQASPMHVYLFRRQQDYLRFTGERWRNSGGVYMSGRNLLAAFLEGQGRDALRRTLQHEAFHQFAHRVISPNMPVWLNEGMAQLFEEGIWTGDGFLLGQVPPRRVRQLQADIKKKRLIRFDRLLALTPDEWSARLADDQGSGATQYNQSWAMVHFLVHARDAAGKEKYRGRLVRMLELLHAGKDARQAFETAYSTNTKGFQDRFVEYATALQGTPEASMIERQEVLADFLIELKNKGRTFANIADLRQAAIKSKYILRYSDRGMSWSSDPDVQTYFSDMTGRGLESHELFFDFRRGAELPDIVCRASERLQFRTRFHPAAGKKLEHEVLVEPPRSQARADD